jgi:uncharacterized DUF497 family protein
MATFEWHNAKAAANLRTHGVSFTEAAKACQDPFAIEWIDTRFPYDEERTIRLGHSGNGILYVACTDRGDTIRIISARKASKHERSHYYRQNAP